jgi:DNA-binding protein H-NS
VNRERRVAFRDPANPDNVWSGRGRPTQWLQDYIEAGRERDDFAATGEAEPVPVA